MYSLFSTITDYIFGTEEVTQPSQSTKEDVYKEKFPGKWEEELLQTETLQTTPVQDEDQRLAKSCFGSVTRLYDGAGVINDEIYFTFDVLVGGFRPELGSEVHLDAARESLNSGWKATRICSFKEWDSNQECGTIEVNIGMINNIKGETIELSDGVNFSSSVFHNQTYSPCRGDWIKVDLERFHDGNFEVRGVKPLRERSFSGRINAVFPGYGYIDEEVYFTFGVCSRGYRPRRGDNVDVTAIESSQGKCNWRAIHVEPKQNQATNQYGPGLGSLQQFMGNKMTQLLADKEGLVIEGRLDFGEIPTGESKTLKLIVRNTCDKAQVFKSCSFVRADPQFEVELPTIPQAAQDGVTLLRPDMEISPQGVACIQVKCTAKSIGRVKQLLVVQFSSCAIGRYLTSCVTDNYQARLAPMAPYQRNRAKGREAWDRFMERDGKEKWIIPGERPTRKTKIIFPIKLKQYNIPSDVRRCIIQQDDLSTVVPSLQEPLTMENHSARFNALLHAEELQMEMDMREFDLQNVTMDLFGEYLTLHVPGLAEGRPSLLIGDTVVVTLSDGSHNAPSYEGYIHEVRKDDILLKFHEDFQNNFGLQPCDVVFYFNRSNVRRAHQAVEFAAQLGTEIVFPRKLESKLPVVSLIFDNDNQASTDKTEQQTKTPQTTNQNPQSSSKREKNSTSKKVDFLYNSNLNERQRAAVCRIASGQCRPTPYVLFGPPGTGKTVTLVEAVLQVFHRIPSSRIIACAPSNSAADLLASRLHSSGFIQEGDMVRLNAFQRGQEIPESIASYCLDTDSLLKAAHYRIIVSTCSTSGQLFSLGLRTGHFTHVFIDEAGQATEPECLVPMGLAAGGEGQIILAGDPYQLGPVLRSDVAIDYGLNISLLERLMSRSLYARDEARFVDHGCYDPLLVTKLVNNYRSHPSLLHLPSTLFYHGELRVFADVKMRESLSTFEMLPKKGVPLVFHGIKGDDLREGNSPSWFNPAEAVQVVRYIQGLKNSSKVKVKSTDIGVVTPYKKQVEKIRLLLRSVSVDDIKVGSVEEFQGQERPVIIISTVRSDQSQVASDVTHSIGFLSNPKRFNVAITRAQCLLIVIGNPHVLCQDPYWCSLVHYCVMNDVYTGCDLPDLNDDLYQDEFQYAMAVLSRIVDKEQDDEVQSTDKETSSYSQIQSQSSAESLPTDTTCSENIKHDSTGLPLHDKARANVKYHTNDVSNRPRDSSIANPTNDINNSHFHDDKAIIQNRKAEIYSNANDVGAEEGLETNNDQHQHATPDLPDKTNSIRDDPSSGSYDLKVNHDIVHPTKNEILQSGSSCLESYSSIETKSKRPQKTELAPELDVLPQTEVISKPEETSTPVPTSNGKVLVDKCYHGNSDVIVTKQTANTKRKGSGDELKMLLGIQNLKSSEFNSQSKFNDVSNMNCSASSCRDAMAGFQGNSVEMTSELSSEHLKQLLGITSPGDKNCCSSNDRACETNMESQTKYGETTKNVAKHEKRRSSKSNRSSHEKYRNSSRGSRIRTKSESPSEYRKPKGLDTLDGFPVVKTTEVPGNKKPTTSKKRTMSVGLPVEQKSCVEDYEEDDLEEFLFQPAAGH